MDEKRWQYDERRQRHDFVSDRQMTWRRRFRYGLMILVSAVVYAGLIQFFNR